LLRRVPVHRLAFWTLLLSLLTGSHSESADNVPVDYARAAAVGQNWNDKVFRSEVAPQWEGGGDDHFWYTVSTGPGTREYVRVSTADGSIQRAPDAASAGIAQVPVTTSSQPVDGPRKTRRTGPETVVHFQNRSGTAVELFWLDFKGGRRSYGKLADAKDVEMRTFAGHLWCVIGPGGREIAVVEASEAVPVVVIDAPSGRREQKTDPPQRREWVVEFADHQVVVRNPRTGERRTLTRDGTAAQPYRGPVAWSPDGRCFVVQRVALVPVREVQLRESAPKDQLQPKTRVISYPKPGDALPRPRLVLFDGADSEPQMVGMVGVVGDELTPEPFEPDGAYDVRWSPKGGEFYFSYNARGHQLYRVLAVDARTAAARVVVEEKASTFIDYTNKIWREWLDDSGELLWMSERDGWAHLWIQDIATGQPKLQLTRGPWVVREVLRVDRERRQLWFMAGGRRAGEDPYHRHLCRVNLDGTGLVQLTEGDGDHEISFSPGQRFFIDRWSRADQPPVVELRACEDGRRIAELERADARALLETGWSLPERFVASGRDGITPIHGILIKPSHFDPALRYPVLEEVYAGPHGAFVPKRFGTLSRQHVLAELGFIVVQADGMGTNHRGKAFHDLAWKNLRDSGFPDRMAWIKAAAATRPWMDLTRVGIYGGSAGGQSAMRAVLEFPEFYRAAHADCGCHDNRMDKIWWNEQWMGWPVDDSYKASSNVEDAHKLGAPLMLCVGEMDDNVDPASTLQVVKALVAADKQFDLLVLPGTGHGAAETPYGSRRRMEFFVRNLGLPRRGPE